VVPPISYIVARSQSPPQGRLHCVSRFIRYGPSFPIYITNGLRLRVAFVMGLRLFRPELRIRDGNAEYPIWHMHVSLCSLFEDIEFRKSRRENNRVAHELARYSRVERCNVVLFGSSCSYALDPILIDCNMYYAPNLYTDPFSEFKISPIHPNF
jgi:hypothetical protein